MWTCVHVCAHRPQARDAARARARLRSEAARLAAAVGEALRHGQEEQEEGHLVEVLPQPGRQRAQVGLEEVDLRFETPKNASRALQAEPKLERGAPPSLEAACGA